MTATALATTLTTTDTIDDVSSPLQAGPRQSWICSSCHLSFGTGQAQREHMKSPWQYVPLWLQLLLLIQVSVYNLKRRIASLPPIPLSIFEEQIQAVAKPKMKMHQNNHTERTEEELNSPYQCLFCPLTFENDHEDVKDVIEHMFTSHGLFIPDQAMLSDSTSFLGYLATQVRVWHECLYCGITRTSTLAIQDHMKDSGHCRLNFEKEPELSDFWECEKGAADHITNSACHSGTKVGRGLKLASGRIVASNTCRRTKPQARRVGQMLLALPAEPEQLQPQDIPGHHGFRQLSRRDELGIQNISSQQRHALTVAVKRSQKDEAIATRAREWSYARKANDQKHDQAHGSLSWAKGGMHNLLPR